VLTRRRLLRSIDAARIKQAIEEAERQTSGEVRVSVSTFFWGDVRKAAERVFARLGMAATRERNGILFFVVPSRRRFVVLGDEGIHAKVGPEFWAAVASAVEGHFRKGAFTDGLVHGIEAAGRELAAHFPFDPERDRNELPDDVDLGRRGR
jgi:uncharacterized membrane protein